MSVLNQCNFSNLKPFWVEKPISSTSVLSQPVVLQDKIFIHSSNSDYLEVDLSMTPKYIYYLPNPQSVKKLKFKWCLIESFYEESSETCLYGFSLSSHLGKQDFFTKSDKTLEIWLEKLSNFCILTGFEQDFMVIKTIDSSNFGNVSLCQDLITSTKYAVKCIYKSYLQNQSQISHIKHEIKTMRLLNHPNIVQLYRVYEEHDAIYLILEYIPCGNLLQRLQKIKKFQEFEVALIAKNLVEAISHMKSAGVVHRDLKLENILMVSELNNFDIKIADFGLASCSKKELNEKCGSPGFMAPEMLAGESYDSKFDIFSAGVVCYSLLRGKLPFGSKNMKKILDRNEKCEVKFERQVWKDYSAIGLNFVQGVLNRNKNERPSAEQALGHPWIYRYLSKSESEGSNFRQTCSE